MTHAEIVKIRHCIASLSNILIGLRKVEGRLYSAHKELEQNEEGSPREEDMHDQLTRMIFAEDEIDSAITWLEKSLAAAEWVEDDLKREVLS